MDNEYLADNQRLFDPSLPVTYNEALPTKLGVLDVFDADETEANFANKWLDTLFGKGKASFPIHPFSPSLKKIEHLFFTARNNERIKGYRNLGFGYPILIKKDGNAQSGLLSAPIFIWSVHLEPNAIKAEHWQLSEKNSMEVRINPILGGISSEMTELVNQYEAKLKKKGMSLSLCLAFCEAIAELLSYQNHRLESGISRYPEIEDLITIQEPGMIAWSGLLASYPPIHLYSLSDSILAKDFWQQNVDAEVIESKYHFCYLPCDHQQKAAHMASEQHKFVMVEGAAGSGKTHTLTNFLIGNLLNGEKTLVVGQSVVELEKIMDNLVQEGFGDLGFLFKNLELDKDNLIDRLVSKAEKALKYKRKDTSQFNMAYKRFEKYKNLLDNAAVGHSKNVFDINNWTETVGLFLKNSRSERKDLLDTQLQVSDFSFDFLEYEQIKDKIEQSHQLFKDEFSFHHPLNDLENEAFLKEDIKNAKWELTTKLKDFLKKARSVQRHYLEEVGAYKKALEEHYEDYYQNLKIKIDNTQDAIDHLELQFGKEYNKTSVGNLKLFKNFSGKSKAALQLKSQILSQYEKVKSYFLNQKYFEFDFSQSAGTNNIEKIAEQLSLFENALQNWSFQRSTLITDNIKRLNSKNTPKSLSFSDRILAIEEGIENLRTDVNAAKLFKTEVLNNAMTLQLKQQLLEGLVEKLSLSLHSLRDFDTFFDWRKLKATFSAKEEKVIKALINVRPKVWSAAFDAWYFHNLLTNQSRQSANFDELLDLYLTNYQSLKKEIPAFIKEFWSIKRREAIAAANKSRKNSLSGLLKKSKSVVAFSTYFQNDFQNIGAIFPIQLMTIETAKHLLKADSQHKFDALIINEGGNFTKEQGGSLLSLANKVQVFGSGKDGLIPSGQSFWEMSKGLAGKHIYLKKQHRKEAIPVLAFNNAAFNQQLEVSMNGKVDSTSLELIEVEGTYNEQERINEQECTHMLKLLNDISGTPQHTYPKVGFACATIEQRNHFASQILKIKQGRTKAADKIKHLERNGLGVYQFEELTGQQFDILIISFTFGIINKKGDFTKDATYFNHIEGEKVLQNVLNAGIQKLKVCSSIPLSKVNVWKRDKDKKALFILANFLEYAQEVNNANVPRLHEIVNEIGENIVTPNEEESSVFLEEVATYLSAYFEPERILTDVAVNNRKFPLVIKGKFPEQANYVIKVDSFFSNADVFSYVWQDYTNKNMESTGYKFLSIWSKDWWRNPEQEARKLASQIIREDGVFANEEMV